MGYPVTLIRGDGIGPEVTAAAQTAIDATGVAIDWQIVEAGMGAMEQYGTPLPATVLDSIRETKIALKGPIITPVNQGFPSVNEEFRRQLNLYANLRPIKLMAGVKSPFQDIDWVIVRENMEDLYAGIEFERTTIDAAEARSFLSKLSDQRIREDSAIGVRSISVKNCGQIVEFAFNYAQANGRRHITAVHKANRMKFTDGLFLEIARDVAADYPDIQFEDQIVDNLCLQLVQTPELFDVLVMPNLYGDILSNFCAGMIGGLGVAPSANIGDQYAIFETIHGSEPQYAGQNKANPTALILSGVLMLHHLGERAAAQKLQMAVETVISAQTQVTYDLAPAGIEPVATQEMAEAIAHAIC
jgi:isocitrate dehydrogenase (NAD+)